MNLCLTYTAQYFTTTSVVAFKYSIRGGFIVLKYIAIIGPSDCSSAERDDAFKIGAMLAARGSILVCGRGGRNCHAVALFGLPTKLVSKIMSQ